MDAFDKDRDGKIAIGDFAATVGISMSSGKRAHSPQLGPSISAVHHHATRDVTARDASGELALAGNMWHPKTVSSWLETSAMPAERRDFDDLYNSISKYRGVGSALNRSSTYQARRPSPVNTAARRRTRSPRRRAPEQSFNKSFTKSFNKSLGNSLRRTRSKSPRHVKWQCAVCAARNTGSLNACEFCGAVRRKRAPVTFSRRITIA